VKAAEQRDPDDGTRVMGVDVARYGDCETVVALRRENTLAGIASWQGADLMESCAGVVRLCRDESPQRAVIDVVGLGAGLYDRLAELQREGLAALAGVQLVPFASGQRAGDPEKFHSRRDEAYFALRDRLRVGRH
jgi:hypothetical protein